MKPTLAQVLYADFLGALTTVVVMLVFAGALEPRIGVPARALRVAGVVLVPFVAFVLHTARSSARPRRRVYGIVAFNLAWLLASLLLLAFGETTAVGASIIALQALLVVPLVFAELRALR